MIAVISPIENERSAFVLGLLVPEHSARLEMLVLPRLYSNYLTGAPANHRHRSTSYGEGKHAASQHAPIRAPDC